MLLFYNTGTGIILGMGSANERRRYNVTSSLIGRAHTQNDPRMKHDTSDIYITIFIEGHVKVPSAKCPPFCSGPNVLSWDMFDLSFRG